MEKSHVGMGCCPICQKENGTILLDTRIRNGKLMESLEKYTIDPKNPCDDCRKKYLENGTLLFCPQNGDRIVLTDVAFTRIFSNPVPKGKIAFCDEDVLNQLNRSMEV